MNKQNLVLLIPLLLASQYSYSSICPERNIQADRNKIVAPKSNNDICEELNIDGDLNKRETIKQWLKQNPNNASCDLAMTLPGMPSLSYSGMASISGGIDVCSAFQTVLDKTSNDISSMVTGLYDEINAELSTIIDGFFDQYATTDPKLVNSVLKTQLTPNPYDDVYYVELWKGIEAKMDQGIELNSEEINYISAIDYNIESSPNSTSIRPYSDQEFNNFQNQYGINLGGSGIYSNNNQLPNNDPSYSGIPPIDERFGNSLSPSFSTNGIPRN